MYRLRRERLASGELARLVHDRATGDTLVVLDEAVTDPDLCVQVINDLVRERENRADARGDRGAGGR